MSTQVTISTADGRCIKGVSHHLPPYLPTAYVPNSPAPYENGMYHLETATGWVQVPVNQIQNISVRPGAPR